MKRARELRDHIQKFSEEDVEKIQKFVLKDTFNKKKKTIIFELEGILVNLFSSAEEAIRYDSKIQIKTQGNEIISNKEYYI